MKVIGLTGGIGAGKSVVASVWAARGARVLTADAYGHRVIDGDSGVQRLLVKHFGSAAVDPDGRANRSVIARKAFASARHTQLLNRIVGGPLVRLLHADIRRIRKRRSGVLVVDAALLCEWASPIDFDLRVLVTAPRRLRLRWLSRRGLSYRRAARRMQAQWPDRRKRLWADVEIRNTGSLRALRNKAERVWSQYIENV